MHTTSNHGKGKAKEREFLKQIGREGYVTPYSNFGEKDMLEIADGLYLGSGGDIVLFQITHRCGIKRHTEAIERFVGEHPHRTYAIRLYAYGYAKDGPGTFRLIMAW